MKTIIICVSVHHGNTKKVANAIADVIRAPVRTWRSWRSRAWRLRPGRLWISLAKSATRSLVCTKSKDPYATKRPH